MLKMVYFKNQNFKRIVNFILISELRKKVLTIKKSVKISSILWYYFKDQICKYLQDNSFTEYWYVYLIYSLMPVIGYLWMYQNIISDHESVIKTIRCYFPGHEHEGRTLKQVILKTLDTAIATPKSKTTMASSEFFWNPLCVFVSWQNLISIIFVQNVEFMVTHNQLRA